MTLDRRLHALDRWGEALVRGDGDEVDRMVRQSRIDRDWAIASEQLGLLWGRDAEPPDGGSVPLESVLRTQLTSSSVEEKSAK